MDGSLPGSSVHGIFQARVLEWAKPELEHSLGGVLEQKEVLTGTGTGSLHAHPTRAKAGLPWGLTFHEGAGCCSHLGQMSMPL